MCKISWSPVISRRKNERKPDLEAMAALFNPRAKEFDRWYGEDFTRLPGYAFYIQPSVMLPVQSVPWRAARFSHSNWTEGLGGIDMRFRWRGINSKERWVEWAVVTRKGERLFCVQQRWRDGDPWWIEYREYVFGLLSIEAYRIEDGLWKSPAPPKSSAP